MKTILAAGLAAVVLAGPALAESAVPPVVGLWQAIDPVDRTVNLFAIYPDGDGAFAVVIEPGYVSTCADADGRGRIDVDPGTYADSTLTARNAAITCADGKTATWDGIAFGYDPATDLITMSMLGRDRPAFTLFRLSQRP